MAQNQTTTSVGAGVKPPPRMRFKHGSYYYVSKGGKWIHLSRDLEEALEKYIEVSALPVLPGTIAELFQRYMVEVVPLKAPRTQADNKSEAINLLKVFGHLSPKDIRPVHIGKYLDERGKAAPVRANREKALLSHVFTKAMRWGIVDMNPCRGVQRNPEKGRSRYITDAEFKAVMDVANQTVKDVMTFSYGTAQRIGDILDILLIDLDEDSVYIQQNKGKRTANPVTLRIGLSPALKEIVSRRVDQHSKTHLFEGREGRKEYRLKPYTHDGIYTMFSRAIKKALKNGTLTEPFTIHDIRAKALTDATRKGRDARQLAGHKHQSMTDHYVKRRMVENVDPLE